jgi:hypothetical protein
MKSSFRGVLFEGVFGKSAVLQNFANANSYVHLQDLIVPRPAPISGFAGQFVVLRN